jgi:hypothetical protein
VRVRAREAADEESVERFLGQRYSDRVARLGELLRPLDHPALIAERDDGSRTTNDNVDALRFYQRRGFRLAELHAGGVDKSRATLKPDIPTTGEYGIPLRDELILEKELGQ